MNTDHLVDHLYSQDGYLAELGTTIYRLMQNTTAWLASYEGRKISRRELAQRRRKGAVQLAQLSRCHAAVRTLQAEIPTDLILDDSAPKTCACGAACAHKRSPKFKAAPARKSTKGAR